MPGYELYGAEERAAILEWFDSNHGVMFAHGFDGIRNGVFKVREFEGAVAKRFGVPYAQAVSSGTAALLVGLRALGVRRGDEVITSAFTFVATVEAILEAGAVPVLTEVDESLTMDLEDLRRRITPRTRVVIPVHMAGASADNDGILTLARQHGLAVLEDAAQAFGGSYRGRPLGTFGDAGVYSFDFAKTITTGEGGMVVTDRRDVYERVRALHDHGHEYNPALPRGRDIRSGPGFNFRMTEVQGVLGLVQLRKLDGILARQRANKAAIKAGIADCGFQFRRLIDPDGDCADTLIFFLDSEGGAGEFADRLAAQGLGTKNLPDALTWHFAGTWRHLFQEIPSLARPEGLWPRTAAYLARAVALPIGVNMDGASIDGTVATIREIARTLGAPARG